MKRRRLNEDDLALWRRVTERTDKLEPSKLFTPEIDAPAPAPPQIRRAKIALQGNKPHPNMKKRSNDLRPTLSEQMKTAPVQMDHKAFGKLKRGKLRPEGRIDLHGMTLVITGKGKRRDEGGPIPVRDGVLRHQVPQWLSMPPLSSLVLQIAQAHVSHGGGGAYYVYLRRNR